MGWLAFDAANHFQGQLQTPQSATVDTAWKPTGH